jgi:methionine-rich copper-binding protein CopC
MNRIVRTSLTLAVILTFVSLFALSAPVASAHSAHGGEGLTVTPATAMPGDKVTLHGEAITQPNGDVDVDLVATSGTETHLGDFKADDTGDLDTEVTLPTTLAPGMYQVQAMGSKTETADLTITAASTTGTTNTTPASTNLVLQPRPFLETLGLVALFGLLAAAGLFFARTARRVREPSVVEEARTPVESVVR